MEEEITLQQYFPVHTLKYDMEERLATQLTNLISPMIKDYRTTLPQKTYKTDHYEPVSILKEASKKSECIDKLVGSLVELGNVFCECMGLGEKKERYFSAWINSFESKDFLPMQHQCKNMFDISGVYCVDNVPDASLTIHNPSPFVQGTPVSSEHNYSKAVLELKRGRVYMFPSWLNHEITATGSYGIDTLVTMHFNFDQNTYLGFKPVGHSSRRSDYTTSGSAGQQRGEVKPKGRY